MVSDNTTIVQVKNQGVVITHPEDLIDSTPAAHSVALYEVDRAMRRTRVPPKPTGNLITTRKARRQRLTKAKTGRNKQCPCGSGKKYKHCCIN